MKVLGLQQKLIAARAVAAAAVAALDDKSPGQVPGLPAAAPDSGTDLVAAAAAATGGGPVMPALGRSAAPKHPAPRTVPWHVVRSRSASADTAADGPC